MNVLFLFGCFITGLPRPTATEVSAVCGKLSGFRIVLAEYGRQDLYQRVRLNVSQEDVNFALRDFTGQA